MSSLIVRTQSLHLPYQWPMQTCLAVTCYRSSQQAPPIFCTTQLRFEGPSSLALTYPALSLCFLPVNDNEKACHIPKYWNKVTLDYFIAQVLHNTVYYSILQYITVYYSILQSTLSVACTSSFCSWSLSRSNCFFLDSNFLGTETETK